MRILAIRGKNLASLRGHFEVALDKAPLEQAGLFAITGHTGAGKSTLLDTMCLALFDRIPRFMDSSSVKIGRSDEDEKLRIASNDVGSIVSRGTASAYAEVDFIGIDKRKYQAHWEIKRARNKVSGRLQKQSVILKKLDNNEVLGQNKSDTLELISERIGLTFEQFRRSVLLAQGDFAAFLKAKTNERSSLLERITGTEIYSKLSVSTYQTFQEQEQLLHRIEDRVKNDVPLENQKRQDLKIEINELSDESDVLNKKIEDISSIIKWHEIKDQLEKEKKSVVHSLSILNDEKKEKAPLKEELKTIASIQYIRPLIQSLDSLNKKIFEQEEQLCRVINEFETVKTNEKELIIRVENNKNELCHLEQEFENIKPDLLKARELDTKIELITHECIVQENVTKDLSSVIKENKQKIVDLDSILNEQKKIEQELVEIQNLLFELYEKRHKISLESLGQEKEFLEKKRLALQGLKQIFQSYSEKKFNLEQYNVQQSERNFYLNELKNDLDINHSKQEIALTILEEARRAQLIMQESVTKGAQSFRGLLKNNQECPVCGSLEHPWAGQELALNQHYHQQSKRVTELEQSVQKKIICINKLQQKFEFETSEKLKKSEQITLIQSELEQMESRWNHEIIDIFIDGEMLQALSDYIHNNQDNSVIVTEITKLNSQYESCKEQEKKGIFLQKKINQYQIKKDQLLNKEKDFEAIISEQKLLLNTLNNLKQQLDKEQNELKKRQFHQGEIQSQRRQIFSNKNLKIPIQDNHDSHLILSAEDVELSFSQTISHLSAQYVEGKNQLEKLQQEKIKLTEQHLNLKDQIKQNKQQKCIQENEIDTELNSHSLSLLELKIFLQYDQQWIKQHQDDFNLLNNELIKTETLLLERNSKIEQHEKQFESFPEFLSKSSKDDLSVQITEQINLQKNTQNRLQEKQLILKQDDEKRERIAEALVELNTQKEIWSDWSALNQLIGSASGQKFRIFAQSLTLESLLIHANEHLNDFARRYQLQRVPGTDLDLQIIDRDMADEVRSVQSLSGGESFLVSLALALGLASLSSSKTQVESLFIDEGFGTLDQETLDIAIASLDTLQGLGRKVGIISHVPILVERIGVRVLVDKIGGGQSRVLIETG
ncbi:MAG: hypothetical protein OQL19_10835 [Gammaproteobacteria bacterium]|nr:hypothetical protein [Gammaproteobacteria bacterium]